MNTDLLRDFTVLAECGSFEEAADRLYTTQSTLSKHIKKLEEDLGVTLFDRTTRHIGITPAGRALLPFAGQMERIEQECRSVLAPLQSGRTQCIRIGMENVSNYTVHGRALTDVILEFQEHCPEAQIDISKGKMFDVYDRLRSGEIDFALLRYRSKTNLSGLEALTVAEDTLTAVVARHHRLAGVKSVTLQDLKGENFLLSTGRSFVHDYIVDACKEAGITPKIIVSDSHMKDAIDLAALNMGIYFCMKKPARAYRNQNVSVLDLEPPLPCTVALCCHSGAQHGAAKQFLSFMRQALGAPAPEAEA